MYINEGQLPTQYVDNEVVWINKDINLPFALYEGEPTAIGRFLVNSDSKDSNGIKLGVDAMHGRSAMLGQVYVTDSEGVVYRDFDLKGTGYLKEDEDTHKPRLSVISIKNIKETWGIWNLSCATEEIELTEQLAKRGMRTNRIAAVIKINELVLPDGKVISVDDAKKARMINPDEVPVIGLRAYRSRTRIEQQAGIEEFQKVKEATSKELGVEMTWDDYLVWFAKTLGKNLGVFHKEGYWHNAPSPHNITLACELVDLTSECPQSLDLLDSNSRLKIMEANKKLAEYSLSKLINDFIMALHIRVEDQEKLYELFDESYLDAFSNVNEE